VVDQHDWIANRVAEVVETGCVGGNPGTLSIVHVKREDITTARNVDQEAEAEPFISKCVQQTTVPIRVGVANYLVSNGYIVSLRVDHALAVQVLETKSAQYAVGLTYCGVKRSSLEAVDLVVFDTFRERNHFADILCPVHSGIPGQACIATFYDIKAQRGFNTLVFNFPTVEVQEVSTCCLGEFYFHDLVESI